MWLITLLVRGGAVFAPSLAPACYGKFIFAAYSISYILNHSHKSMVHFFPS